MTRTDARLRFEVEVASGIDARFTERAKRLIFKTELPRAIEKNEIDVQRREAAEEKHKLACALGASRRFRNTKHDIGDVSGAGFSDGVASVIMDIGQDAISFLREIRRKEALAHIT